MGHVMDQPNPNECLQLIKEQLGVHLIPDYGPVNSVNRPVRTRTRGGVGAGGIKPPGYPIGPFHFAFSARISFKESFFFLLQLPQSNLRFSVFVGPPRECGMM